MSQHYIGVKQVFAYPEARAIHGKTGMHDGYHVVYDYGTPREYHSWSPKDVFEAAYFPMGHANDGSKITEEMVRLFLSPGHVCKTVGEKTTLVLATMLNGFEVAESSSCVDKKNYDESLGEKICHQRVKDRAWQMLGFVLQWARNGIKK